MIVLVCGGRHYSNASHVNATLSRLHCSHSFIHIVHGDASGADRLGRDWAIANSINSTPYPANWRRYGRRAGYVRNQLMLDDAHPDLIVAFPGGRGTSLMMRLARDAGVPVHEACP